MYIYTYTYTVAEKRMFVIMGWGLSSPRVLKGEKMGFERVFFHRHKAHKKERAAASIAERKERQDKHKERKEERTTQKKGRKKDMPTACYSYPFCILPKAYTSFTYD